MRGPRARASAAPRSWPARAPTPRSPPARAAGIEPLPLGRPALSGAAAAASPTRRPSCGCAGDVAALARPAVAIVGSRAATPYALEVADRLAAELADRGMVVVSGLARGVDSAAHRGCLAGGGADRRGARLRARPHLSAGARRRWPERYLIKGCWSASSGQARRRCRSTFRCGTVSSAGSRWPSWSSKPRRRAGRSSPPAAPSNRAGTSWRCPAACCRAGTAAPTVFSRTGQRSSRLRTIFLRSSGGRCAEAPRALPSKLLISDHLLARMEIGEVYRLDELMELTGVTGTRLLPRLMELELAGLVTQSGSGFRLGLRRAGSAAGGISVARLDRSIWQSHSSWWSRRRRRRPSTNISARTTRSSPRWATSAICPRASWAWTIDEGFEPSYEVIASRKKVIKELKDGGQGAPRDLRRDRP